MFQRFQKLLLVVSVAFQIVLQLEIPVSLDGPFGIVLLGLQSSVPVHAIFPFGQSILEQVFKVYKQKELLEDAIIIYRVQRAPERRVFYIDVGNMPTHLAMQFVERVKNEINQRRIPSTSGGVNYIDATYNPMSINEDYFFPQTAEGRGSKVDTLPASVPSWSVLFQCIDSINPPVAPLTESKSCQL